ncbi:MULTISPECIES: phosphonoacetaldehyde hydrolase [unclassified Bosea (in: a-proteobacteria)]|uniref:phosphonoacetaldehyde hydrolase n=1 Tax=unclassified Bosea (in: a-proteobacteria) TaxID=2653178 RepID=UPI000F75051F|nr:MULTISPECIES: phosphonoacetaldehyde hydrolase [unclassified Bosea (in: a-proteobacteria)]AZO79515.1 phosphonoacetaldehyde hydrolase [Bosea sp. Tri-49]RXT16242.1 phosphonoacetaldehyde hydrolase [Bosea sp. Tri-39]RXT39935.1 phosphonoacetaldehyde hydrolase [Bosea sp. Tri-54]
MSAQSLLPFHAVKAVVLDWAGTVVDFGSRAPMGAFVEVFARFGVTITIPQARGPMGLPKRAHIAALMAVPAIAQAWRTAHGEAPGEAAIDAVYEQFVPLNAAVVTDYADLIPGAADNIANLRRRGLKIGSTTGYTREIMERLLPVAAAQGYEPDNLVCAGDLAEGRPSPLMMYRCFADLGVYPPSSVIKVDDTEPGIAEGAAAGTWTVGLAVSGNCVGLSLAEWNELPLLEQQKLRGEAAARLRAAGADYVIDSIAELVGVVEAIEATLAARQGVKQSA